MARIVFFTETFLPRVDGIVNTLKWALRGLVDAGWEALVVAPTGNTQTLPGVRVIGAPSIVFPLYPEVRLAWPTPEVWKRVDAFRPDLVHLAGPVTNGFGGLKYAQSRHLPLISTYHTALPAYARLYGLDFMVDWAWDRLREVHNATSATLCPSHSTVAELEGRGFERVRLWARGVDARLFAPQMRSPAARARLGAADGELVVLYVGRLAREKKLDRLAAALRRVSGVRAALVGDGPDRARLERVFAGLPVTFTGVLQGADLSAAYAAADVFAFPSDTDTFGNVVLEAMACGLPVVASSVGGQLDLVDPGASGLLFAPEDVDEFALQLERYRDDPLLRERHGACGLALARQRTWPRQIELLLEHYRVAMAEREPVLIAA
jgi:glycosyltransferase involved in cell wall biosynthesis